MTTAAAASNSRTTHTRMAEKGSRHYDDNDDGYDVEKQVFPHPHHLTPVGSQAI
jgi:hypothetical protein